jgi:hypothetical protein
LLIGHGARTARAVLVRQPFEAVFGKPSPPLADSMFGMAQFGGDRLADQAIRASQNDPAPVRKRPRCLMLAQLGFQKAALLIAQFNRNRCPTPHTAPRNSPPINDGKFGSR